MISWGLIPSKTKTCNLPPVLTGVGTEPVPTMQAPPALSYILRALALYSSELESSFRAGFLSGDQLYLQFSTELKSESATELK